MNFIPESVSQELEVPWFEEATTAQHGVRGHNTGKGIDELQGEIRAVIGRLGGSVRLFVAGTFPGQRKRYGYEVRFEIAGHEGRILIAALPLKKETPAKKTATLKQALYTVREHLQAQYNLLLLSPGSNPLLPYLLADGQRTVAELYRERYEVPMLASGDHIVEGEVVD